MLLACVYINIGFVFLVIVVRAYLSCTCVPTTFIENEGYQRDIGVDTVSLLVLGSSIVIGST